MMDDNVDSIIESLRVSPRLLLEFFVTFARFEYALKATGFRNDARVSWSKFITWIENENAVTLRPVLDVGRYLLENPPKKLVITKGNPKWNPADRDDQSDIRFLLDGVQLARNNLFHGGKWLTSPDSPDRNQNVLETALGVLVSILRLDAACDIRREFEATG